MAGALRPPHPPSEDWSRTYGSGSDDSDDSSSTSQSGDSDEERPSSRNTQRGCGCCGKRAPAAPPPDASSEKDGKGKPALARTLRQVAAVHDDEVPSQLWSKPSRALALERAEAHQPRFKARAKRLCARARAARRAPAASRSECSRCAQATDGRWYSYDVLQTTAQQIGRAFGAGYGTCRARASGSGGSAARGSFKGCAPCALGALSAHSSQAPGLCSSSSCSSSSRS